MPSHLGLSDRLCPSIQRYCVLFKGGSDFAKTLWDKKLTVISLMGMIVCPKQCAQVAWEHHFSSQSVLHRTEAESKGREQQPAKCFVGNLNHWRQSVAHMTTGLKETDKICSSWCKKSHFYHSENGFFSNALEKNCSWLFFLHPTQSMLAILPHDCLLSFNYFVVFCRVIHSHL